jgi:hypothetical protein
MVKIGMSRNKIDKCDYCGKKGFTHRFDYPQQMPDTFYDMFPEERGKVHPEDFRLCFHCIVRIGEGLQIRPT